MSAGWIGRLGPPALLASALACAWAGWRRAPARAALAAVDAREFAALAGREPAAAGDLWERLKIMGVSAALLREETLADLAARGEVLSFGSAEVEKWRAAGLVAPDSPLRGGTLWARDPRALERAAAALAVRGVDAATTSFAGARALALPAGIDPAAFPAGFQPAAVEALASAGLLPVAEPAGATAEVVGQAFRVRTLPADASAADVLRAAYGRPLRLIVFRPRPGLDLEAQLDALRASLRVLRAAGLPAVPPPPAPPPAEPAPVRRARLALVWLLGALGPLAAVRAALEGARRARPLACRFAAAAPAGQVLAGLAAAQAAAALAGLAALGVSPAGWNGSGDRAWMLWTWCAPLAAGGAILLGAKPPGGRFWSSPVRRGDVAAAAGLALAAALLLAPRVFLRLPALWDEVERLPAPWWWAWRWREAALGVPALVVALFQIEAAAARPSEPPSDPRAWLWLGLLAPAGMIAALGSGVPAPVVLAHGAGACVLGAALAAVLAGLRGLWKR
ncbi:MAG: hypothetical protein HY552_03155 [Elusimicrobia bacterium]|nr:hypothetical protein [Elusimicrobiota bacterium]